MCDYSFSLIGLNATLQIGGSFVCAVIETHGTP